MGSKKSEEIITDSVNRARLLMDYLCSHSGEDDNGNRTFFMWFKQEKYSWYAIMVLEECLKIASVEDTGLTDKQYMGIMVYLLGLYKESGRERQYYELCEKAVSKYTREKEKLNTSQTAWLQNVAMAAGDYYFFDKKDYKKAFSFYSAYSDFGGERISVRLKKEYCDNEERISETKHDTVDKETSVSGEFEEITARFMGSKPIAAGEEYSKYFVGRDEWIRDYCGRLRSGIEGILVFYGQYRVGKTSVLEHLKYYLRDDFEIVDVSMGDMIDPGHFYSEVVRRIREGTERKKKYKDLVRSFMERVDENGALKASDLEEFIDVVDERLAEEGGHKKLLLFLDEFSGMVNKESFVNDDRFLNILRQKVNEQKLQVVITGAEAMQQCMQNWKNFFGKCTLEKLEYLAEDATYQLLEEPIRMSDGTSRWASDRKTLHRVYNLTKGHPHITQTVGNMIVQQLNARKQNVVDDEIINEIENEVLSEKVSDWKLRFHPLLDCGTKQWNDEDVIEICAKVENAGEKGLSEKELLDTIADTVGNKELYKILCDRGIIKRNAEGNTPQVYMELFGKWCRSWYELK